MQHSKMSMEFVGREMKTLIDEAETALIDARKATGEKAEELQRRASNLISEAISKAHDLEGLATKLGGELSKATGGVISANPWRSIAVAGMLGAGIGAVVWSACLRK